MTKILVFGASGFVGRALVSELSKYNYNIVAITRSSVPDRNKLPGVSYKEAPDDQDLQSLNISNIDFVFNCAGEVSNSDGFYNANVLFVQKIIKFCNSSRVKIFIQLSSVGSYGASIDDDIVTESYIKKPKNLYEMSKAGAETLIANSLTHSEYTVLQPSNIVELYGGKRSHRVLATALKCRLWPYGGVKLNYCALEVLISFICKKIIQNDEISLPHFLRNREVILNTRLEVRNLYDLGDIGVPVNKVLKVSLALFRKIYPYTPFFKKLIFRIILTLEELTALRGFHSNSAQVDKYFNNPAVKNLLVEYFKGKRT